MLNLKDIDVTLSKGTKLEYQVLQKLNLSVSAGEFIIIIGGNGAGKTTLLNVVSGFLRADSGKVIIDDEDVTTVSQSARAELIAKVVQDPKIGTMENMTILENMSFAYKRGAKRTLCLFKNEVREKLFREKLAMLNMGLEHKLDEVVANLSGGQRQALSIIMMILAGSKVLLLDEITAALDPKAAKSVIQLANKIIREENRTCLMITHNMSYAIEYGDRTLLLERGKFIKEFTKADKKRLTPALLAAEFNEA